jgi:hypothetical protein
LRGWGVVVLVVIDRDALVAMVAFMVLGKIDDRAHESIGGVAVTRVVQELVDGRDRRLDDEQGHEHDGQRRHSST